MIRPRVSSSQVGRRFTRPLGLAATFLLAATAWFATGQQSESTDIAGSQSGGGCYWLWLGHPLNTLVQVCPPPKPSGGGGGSRALLLPAVQS